VHDSTPGRHRAGRPPPILRVGFWFPYSVFDADRETPPFHQQYMQSVRLRPKANPRELTGPPSFRLRRRVGFSAFIAAHTVTHGLRLGARMKAVTPHSTFLSVALWSLVAIGIYCLLGSFWSLPNEFLTGFSAAAGIALINSFGNLGGFVGPYAIGAISKMTGSFHGGLVFAAISLFASAMMILALRKELDSK